MKLLRIFALILFFSEGSEVFAQTLDPVRITKANPATVKVNEETTVTIEATVTASETLIPNSINLLRYNQSNELVANLGAMFDDGTNGDQVAGDRIYTRQVTLKEAQTGTLLLKVSAAYRGQMRRLLSTAQEIKVISTSIKNLSITILEPFDNAIIDDETVTVIGRFEGPLGMGISVNGKGAAITGNQFAQVLKLNSGSNKINVAATVINGASIEKMISVTRSAVVSDFQVVVTEEEGLAPLKVGYLTQNPRTSINKMEVDFDGDGTFDTATATPSKPLYHVFTQAGVYQSIVRVTDAQQQVVQKKIVILVQSQEEIDQTIRSILANFVQALAGLNETDQQSKAELVTTGTTALTDPKLLIIGEYFSGEARDRYTQVLSRLRKDLPSILPNIKDLVTLRVSYNIVEYGLNRTRDGKKIAFILTWLRGEDGTWRLKAM